MIVNLKFLPCPENSPPRLKISSKYKFFRSRSFINPEYFGIELLSDKKRFSIVKFVNLNPSASNIWGERKNLGKAIDFLLKF